MFAPQQKPTGVKLSPKERKINRLAKAKALGFRTQKVSSVKKRVWRSFSTYIRTRDCTDGMGACISCGRVYPYEDLQAGHYIAKSVASALYFDEDNVNIQCQGCNLFKHGNQLEYGIRLREKIGPLRIQRLLARRHDRKDWTFDALLDVEEEIRRKMAILESSQAESD
jgi:5-methylcytosine-specific restriction endonuclease McrA